MASSVLRGAQGGHEYRKTAQNLQLPIKTKQNNIRKPQTALKLPENF